MTEIKYVDNKALAQRLDKYETLIVDVPKIMDSWKASLYSYEWLHPDGRLKTLEELPLKEQPKRAAVETLLQDNKPLERPVLGIGIIENIEIGIGRAVFLTLVAHDEVRIEVHVRKSHHDDFAPYIVKS